MKTLFLLLVTALYWPLQAQIVFEELDAVNGTIFSVDECRTGIQSALTSDALFGKLVTSPNWIERSQDVTNVYDIRYSPDGDLYTKNDSLILYSQDNGVTFTVIAWPNGIYPPFDFTWLYVLDNDVLFINDWSGHCFYSINNGQSWVWVGQLILSSDPVVKLVGNFIYISDPSITGAGIIGRINVNTNESDYEDITSQTPYQIIYSQILDDGTVYMFGIDISGPENEFLLLQYKFGQNVESLGPFPNPTDMFSFFAAGSTVYNFGLNAAEVFNGFEFEPLIYIGLPQDGEKWFIHSENDHVYAIVDNHRIFRSVGTLTYPDVISGKITRDESLGCIPDTSGTGLAYWNVTIEGENFFRSGISGPDGKFRYPVPEGDYTVSVQPPSNGWELCDEEIDVTVDENQPTPTADFYSKATVNCAYLSLDFSTPLLRRCFENYYTIRVRNTGPEISTGTTLVLHLDPFFEFIFCFPPLPSNR
jgi:hypothetical protein